jgi:hypothetical protein
VAARAAYYDVIGLRWPILVTAPATSTRIEAIAGVLLASVSAYAYAGERGNQGYRARATPRGLLAGPAFLPHLGVPSGSQRRFGDPPIEKLLILLERVKGIEPSS